MSNTDPGSAQEMNSSNHSNTSSTQLQLFLFRPSISLHLQHTNFQSTLNCRDRGHLNSNEKDNCILQENGRYSKYSHCSDYYNNPIDCESEIFGRESVPLPPLSVLSPFYFVHEKVLTNMELCLEPTVLSCSYDCFNNYFYTGENCGREGREGREEEERERERDGKEGEGRNDLDKWSKSPNIQKNRKNSAGATLHSTSSQSTTESVSSSSSSIFNIFSSRPKGSQRPQSLSLSKPVVATTAARRRGSFGTGTLSSNSLNTQGLGQGQGQGQKSGQIPSRNASYGNSMTEEGASSNDNNNIINNNNKWELDSQKSNSNSNNKNNNYDIDYNNNDNKHGNNGNNNSNVINNSKRYHNDVPSLTALRMVLTASDYPISPPIFPLGGSHRKESVGSNSASASTSCLSVCGGDDYSGYSVNYNYNNYGSNSNSSSYSNINANNNNNNNNSIDINNIKYMQKNLKRGHSGLFNIKTNAPTGTRTRGSISSSANNSTHGFGGGSVGYGLSDVNMGISGNFDNLSVCSDVQRQNNAFRSVSTDANLYVPLFACLEDGLGHGDSSENILCLLHSALLLKAGIMNNNGNENDLTGGEGDRDREGGGGGGDSLIDYEDGDRDSILDTESIASSTQYWEEKGLAGLGLGFGSSFFAAVVGAGTSWMSSSGKSDSRKGNILLSQQTLLNHPSPPGT